MREFADLPKVEQRDRYHIAARVCRNLPLLLAIALLHVYASGITLTHNLWCARGERSSVIGRRSRRAQQQQQHAAVYTYNKVGIDGEAVSGK